MKGGTLVAWWVRNAFQINLAHFGALIGEKKLSLLSNLEACSLFFFFFPFFCFFCGYFYCYSFRSGIFDHPFCQKSA